MNLPAQIWKPFGIVALLFLGFGNIGLGQVAVQEMEGAYGEIYRMKLTFCRTRRLLATRQRTTCGLWASEV